MKPGCFSNYRDTSDLSPAVEARLIRQAQKEGVPVPRYIDSLLANPAETSIPKEAADNSPYIERLRPLLKRFDELPRLAPIHEFPFVADVEVVPFSPAQIQPP